MRFDIKKPYKNNWAYINWLQTDKVLILPKFNAPEDEQAFEQISTLMPEYEGKIVTVEATDLIRHEGCLNCASWTVYEPERDRLRTHFLKHYRHINLGEVIGFCFLSLPSLSFCQVNPPAA